LIDTGAVVSMFRPPFDIIPRMAQEAHRCSADVTKAELVPEAACPTLLPLLDELRTFCYEHKIEEIPALLAV
jgi:hypothetical protein